MIAALKCLLCAHMVAFVAVMALQWYEDRCFAKTRAPRRKPRHVAVYETIKRIW